MCNCRLKYPRGISIVTCILLYISLIGLLVAYFQPYWLVIPKESTFGCLNDASDLVERRATTEEGSCGFSGMCYPMNHINKIANLTCYPEMGQERCIWYDSLEKIGNIYDQTCTLLFLAGLALCVFAWLYTLIGCCSLTCCCCNLYTFVSILLTFGVVAILVSVLLWLGMMGEYKISDESCPSIFCDNVGMFDLGSCSIGWSGYLGIISWVVVVVCAGLATYNAHTYSIDIRAAIDDERLNPNARMRKAGKIPVTESYSHVSNRTSGSDNVFQQNHMENNGFVPNRPVPNRAMPTNGFAAHHPRGTIAWDQ